MQEFKDYYPRIPYGRNTEFYFKLQCARKGTRKRDRVAAEYFSS